MASASFVVRFDWNNAYAIGSHDRDLAVRNLENAFDNIECEPLDMAAGTYRVYGYNEMGSLLADIRNEGLLAHGNLVISGT